MDCTSHYAHFFRIHTLNPHSRKQQFSNRRNGRTGCYLGAKHFSAQGEFGLRVLISAYAVCPGKGSEPGVGWNWISRICEHVELTVITEAEFRSEITSACKGDLHLNSIDWHFLDVGEAARTRCWNQGDWRFYLDYFKWQWNAYLLAKNLHTQNAFAIVHHLNMNGYREPGFLWLLPTKFVIGPIGGFGNFPFGFFSTLSWTEKVKQTTRSLINSIQQRISIRYMLARHRAARVLFVSNNDLGQLERVSGRFQVIHETGSQSLFGEPNTPIDNGIFRLCWSGKNAPRKQLQLAIESTLAAIPFSKRAVHLKIVGVERADLPRHILELIDRNPSNIELLGRVNHTESVETMRIADAFLFTSVLEGTPHVVLEALSVGTPVICHDCYGHGDIVDKTCGISIPLSSYPESLLAFRDAIVAMANDEAFRSSLSHGAIEAAKANSWDKKVSEMVSMYELIKSV